MNAFDKYMKEKIDKEDRSVPDIIKERVEQSISELPEKKSKIFLTTSLKLRTLQLSDSFFALSGAYTP